MQCGVANRASRTYVFTAAALYFVASALGRGLVCKQLVHFWPTLRYENAYSLSCISRQEDNDTLSLSPPDGKCLLCPCEGPW